jgi:hypothetical protein
MVGAVEKVMHGVSDGLVKEWKDKKRDEEEVRARSEMEKKEREERNRKEEIRLRKLEKRIDTESRENEDRWKEKEARVKSLVERMEREVGKVTGEVRSNGGGDSMKEVNGNLEDRIRVLEEKLKDGGSEVKKGDREVQVRIDKLELELKKDRVEREDTEWNNKEEKVIQDAKESEKEMEKKLEGAMEQMKILNLDFGKECADRKVLVKEAISKMKEKVMDNDREEFERIMRGARVEVLGKCTSPKEIGKGRIHTVPVLITCGCRNMKDRLEVLVRKAGLSTTIQWPKECMEFVDKIREKVDTMGYGRKDFYTKVRPTLIEGRVFLRADTKKKEGGKFERLAYWRVPPSDKDYWKRIVKLTEPEWMAGKQSG